MENNTKYLFLSAFIISFLYSVTAFQRIALAQLRGQDSQQFFERGNKIIEEQVRELQRKNAEVNQEEDTPKLTTELESNNSEPTEMQKVPETEPEAETEADNLPSIE